MNNKDINLVLTCNHTEKDDIWTKMSKIRDAVNTPWQQNVLLADEKKRHQLYVCMDVIRDSQRAIDDYKALPDFTNQNGGNLYLYGLLQALFTQQDAVDHITSNLLNKPTGINWKDEYPKIYNIRELRNNAIGHPTNRKSGKSFHLISQFSLCKSEFTVVSYYENNNYDLSETHCNVSEIIDEQQNTVVSLLDDILTDLRQRLKTHKMKFKEDKLVEKMPIGYGYSIEKLGEGISSNYSIVGINLGELKSGIDNLKSAIAQRYNDDKTPWCIEEIEYILQRFDEWIKNGTLFQNRDAGIFHYALGKKFDELKELLEQIDEEFS